MKLYVAYLWPEGSRRKPDMEMSPIPALCLGGTTISGLNTIKWLCVAIQQPPALIYAFSFTFYLDIVTLVHTCEFLAPNPDEGSNISTCCSQNVKTLTQL